MNSKIVLLCVMLMTLFFSCDEEKDLATTGNLGDLSVSVGSLGYGSYSLEGIEVFTKPASKQGVTDAYGSVLLTGLEVGSYEVFASKSTYGSGKTTVFVEADNLTKATVVLLKGVEVGIAPKVNVIFPLQPAEYSTGDTIHFSADVEDEETDSPNLKVKWESDIDGVLNTDAPSALGNVSFSTSTLSKAEHNITLTVEDEDGYVVTKTFVVSTLCPVAVELKTPLVSDTGVVLSWEKYPADDFAKIEVYRQVDDSYSNFELIGLVQDQDVLSFTDETPPIAYSVKYFIRITNSVDKSRNSTIVEVENPCGEVFSLDPSEMLLHPNETYVYLVDNSRNSIVKFDYSKLKITKTIALEGKVGRCCIGDNGFGVEIYVPSDNGYIYVYDEDNLALTTKILTGKENASVESDGKGHLIVGLDPSPDAWWTNPIRTFSRSTGNLIDGGGDHENDIVRRIPGTSEFISISTGVSPVDMEYFRLSATGSLELHKDDSYHGDHRLSPYIFKISDNGEYLVTSNKGTVYTANSTMTYLGDIDSGTLNFCDFAFSKSGDIIYGATANRKSIQLIKYPTFQREQEILLNSYAKLIVKKDTKLIALCKSSSSSLLSIIKVIEVEE